MKKKITKKIYKKNYAYSTSTGQPIDISNCIQVGEDVKFPEYDINKKIQKKLLKELPFEFVNKKSPSSKMNIKNNEDSHNQKEIIKEIVYTSGIIKTITKNEKDEIIHESIDYSKLRQNYIQNLKNNLNNELELLVNNSFLLYNRKPIIKKIVKNPVSTKVLADKICLWKYYIKELTNEEKAHLIRKLFFYLEKFTNNCFEEFLEIKEIKDAYELLNPKNMLNNIKEDEKTLINKLINKFHFLNTLIKCDSEGNPLNNSSTIDEDINFKTFLFTSCILNKKEEFKGTGCGYVFLRELRDIANMFTNASIIFDDIFQECYKIFDVNEFINVNKIESYRILWNFYSEYFINNIFMMNLFLQLKYLFGMYKQYDIIKFMHKLILVKYNIFDTVEKMKAQLIKMIGPEGEFDDYKNIKKMKNIDDIIKYIEEGENKKNKKHKKKKKKMESINIDNNNIEDKKDEQDDNYIDIDDGLSIISENDSVLEDFRNDIMAETEYNLGKKIIPILSSEFLNKFSDE